jgi:hypothetical protein
MATPLHGRIRLLLVARSLVHMRAQRTAASSVPGARNIGPLIVSAPAIGPLRGDLPGPAGAQPALVSFPSTGSRALARLRRAGPWRAGAGGGALLRRVGDR